MRYTLQERVNLFRAALTGSGQWMIPGPINEGYGNYLMRRLVLAVGPVPTPTNSSSSVPPVTGSLQGESGRPTPPASPEEADWSKMLSQSGESPQDGDRER